MFRFAEVCEEIAATTRKNEKIAILARYFAGRTRDEAALSALFLSGRVFPSCDERTLDVGAALLWRAVSSVFQAPLEALDAAYRRHGDLGDVAEELGEGRAPRASTLTLAEVRAAFDAIAAASGPAAKLSLVERLLGRATAVEAKYLIKVVTGDLRIGLKESLVEDAIAAAFGAPATAVRRANMLLGDVGEALLLAAEGRLDEARLRPFHPLGFQLASPAASAAEALESIAGGYVEDKFDGIRAHAHVGGGHARLFSRTRDDVTASFPELLPALGALPDGTILDGEIVAFQDGRAMPFGKLQRRLGRKTVSAALQREVPVVFVAFDVLAAGGELCIDAPLSARRALLAKLTGEARAVVTAPRAGEQLGLFREEVRAAKPPARLLLSEAHEARTPEALEALFEAARARGNEGLMIKDPGSTYAPGRRGRAWLKLKRALSTLDVVVTAVEHGHGKRARWLSDYTFAVRDGRMLRDVGKAYSGLTDAEIEVLTEFFKAHALGELGGRILVEPRIVLEVAFDAVMRSERHDSGFALRFPRIVRLREDKSPEEIDTLAAVEGIYARQHPGAKGPEGGEGEAA